MHATGSGDQEQSSALGGSMMPSSITPSSGSPANPCLNVVLYQPEIPQNTGNIGRTCVALGARLWIVRPTGFRMDAAHLRRAGLDYWEHLDWQVVDSWTELGQQLPLESAWLVTKFGSVDYSSATYHYGDILVIGRETSGLPESIRSVHPADRQISVPMPGPVRSLNQATCTGIVMYEAYRQIRSESVSAPSSQPHQQQHASSDASINAVL